MTNLVRQKLYVDHSCLYEMARKLETWRGYGRKADSKKRV